MKALVGTLKREKDLVGAFSWHCETSRRFVDRCSAGRGAGECVISSLSSWRPCLCCPDQLAPSPLLANTGAGGGGQHGPCLLQEVGTTVPHTHLPLDTQFRIDHDVCRQAARARRPRGRAAERSLLFVRFKVGGSHVSAGCGRLEPRNKGAGEKFGDFHHN